MKSMKFKALLAGALAVAALPTVARLDAQSPRSALPPLDYDAWLWNWDARWFASEWNHAFSELPWRYDHVTKRAGSMVLRLDQSGSAQIKTGNGTKAQTTGLWEAEVTPARFRPGVIQAPLWLYNQETKDEIDFEFAGENGLYLTMHTYSGGYRRQVVRVAGVQAGVRHRFGIRMDQAAGYVDMIVDGRVVHRFNKAGAPGFVSSPMNPIFELWSVHPNKTDFVEWAGRFAGISGSDKMEMILHGYRYTAL